MLGGDHDPVRPAAPSAAGPAAPGHLRARGPRPRWARGRVPGEVGIWVFILGDLLVFALFFGIFMVERVQDLEGFRAGRDGLHTALGAINTLLLLTGSLLVVLAMHDLRDGSAARAPRLVLGAAATGVLFVVNKGIEYADVIGAGHGPGTDDFHLLFFLFTGIHLLHLLVGLGALAWLFALARRGPPGPRDRSTAESCASYWHLVDLLWVLLFALLYLVG